MQMFERNLLTSNLVRKVWKYYRKKVILNCYLWVLWISLAGWKQVINLPVIPFFKDYTKFGNLNIALFSGTAVLTLRFLNFSLKLPELNLSLRFGEKKKVLFFSSKRSKLWTFSSCPFPYKGNRIKTIKTLDSLIVHIYYPWKQPEQFIY